MVPSSYLKRSFLSSEQPQFNMVHGVSVTAFSNTSPLNSSPIIVCDATGFTAWISRRVENRNRCMPLKQGCLWGRRSIHDAMMPTISYSHVTMERHWYKNGPISSTCAHAHDVRRLWTAQCLWWCFVGASRTYPAWWRDRCIMHCRF